MSDIIEKLQTRYTGMRSIMHGKQLPLLSSCKAQPTNAPSYGLSQEYEMRVHIGTLFQCNPAQLERAEDTARRMLAREIYKDVYHAIDRMRMQMYSYDCPMEMLEELAKLERCIQ